MNIVLIEGLWSFRKGYVRNVYAKALRDQGHKVISRAYGQPVPYDTQIIIAHSFGAGYALYYKNNFKKPVMLITMDAREWKFWRQKNYRRPVYAHKHINYYQSGAFNGSIIWGGADNYGIPSFMIPKGRGNQHTRLPSAVYDDVMRDIKEWVIKNRGV